MPETLRENNNCGNRLYASGAKVILPEPKAPETDLVEYISGN